jgi:hypothetical protein
VGSPSSVGTRFDAIALPNGRDALDNETLPDGYRVELIETS